MTVYIESLVCWFNSRLDLNRALGSPSDKVQAVERRGSTDPHLLRLCEFGGPEERNQLINQKGYNVLSSMLAPFGRFDPQQLLHLSLSKTSLKAGGTISRKTEKHRVGGV